MSFNLIAVNPKKYELKFFNRSSWIWHPIWEYVETNHPTIASKVLRGHSNDGDGLDEQYSEQLGLLIEQEVFSGFSLNYVKIFNKFLDDLEDVKCLRCFGYGLNRVGIMKVSSSTCIRCNGSGYSRPLVCSYKMNVNDLHSFSYFLKNCRGFQIW